MARNFRLFSVTQVRNYHLDFISALMEHPHDGHQHRFVNVQNKSSSEGAKDDSSSQILGIKSRTIQADEAKKKESHSQVSETETVEGEPIKQKEVPNEASSRRSSLKDILSDGRRSSLSDRRDSDTLSELEEEYLRKMLSDRRGSFRPQPKQTVAYQVQPSDTLEGIAIRYNITPSELTVLNKLNSRVVFPGQTIYIPEKNSLQALEDILKQSAAAIVASSSSSSEQNSPKPGHVERVAGSASETTTEHVTEGSEKYTPENVSALEQDLKEKVAEGAKESLRVNSKYVTDGEGVVSGILIVTTNHIIFDPNVSDPLVIEYGMEKYGVEAPMNCIVRAALYTDIFRMKIKDVSVSDSNIDVYHSKNLSMKKSKSNIEKLGKIDKPKPSRRYSSAEVGNKRIEFGIPFSNSFQENLSKICEATDPDEEENETDTSKPPSPPNDDDAVTVPPDSSTNLTESDGSKHNALKSVLSNSSSFDSEDGYPSRKASMSDDDIAILAPESGSPKKKSNFEKTKHKLHKGLKKLSLTDGLFSAPHGGRRMSLPAFSSLPDFKHKNSSTKSPVSNDKSTEKPKSGSAIYVNLVDEKPELFAPLDKLIPRPAKSFCDTPLYLCLRMGQPINKTSQTHTSVIHFGHKMKPEYWFSIPKDSVDNLYFFFLRWCPDKYGDIDKIDMEALGFLPIEPESHDEPEEKVIPNHRRASWAFPWRRKSKDVSEISTTSSPEDWEFLDYLGAKTETVHPPELLTPSKILTDEQLLEINKHLPARAMNPWELIYGSYAHGFSLKTMYRAMTQYDNPILIVIVNRNDAIFGAFLSSPLRMSDHFYGTGESFLFTFCPEFKIFHWSGENDYFIKGNVDSFFVGSSEGHFGLWLDDDLFHGRTNSCQTFANDPLCPEEDFEVKSLEAWGFV
ncbi:nuclear receptor coactivator 7 [Nephila pilipes]|uniref:Oxidation resistance protein 1 n=1 Tax=Nephila pilipes TaxID=299642 RepID=A0A8X6UEU4_NEPPI|nr:nuclear receptor coactivator 7 [Nephila pilipes]